MKKLRLHKETLLRLENLDRVAGQIAGASLLQGTPCIACYTDMEHPVGTCPVTGNTIPSYDADTCPCMDAFSLVTNVLSRPCTAC